MWSIAYAWKLRSGTDIAVPLWPVQFLVFLGFFLLTLQTLANMAEAIHRLAGRKGTGQAIET
jgi:TRAP-type mannitol/chloroaromatic compound transport system permease small subunit